MPLSKRYNPRTSEPNIQENWMQSSRYHFQLSSEKQVFSIDTPPPTVSGHLHLGHVYSYSHADFIARFMRMTGHNVFYPMGFDDNGLPTERLVERSLGINALEVGRSAFIEKCLEVSEEAEEEYRQLWTRLGLSIDWRYTYRTIDDRSRRLAQLSFLDLFKKGLAYRDRAPAIWCPECQTAIAQAELDDLERETTFFTLAFQLPDSHTLPIATTRPELLPACVAVFVHPDDDRYNQLIGQDVILPHYGRRVPLLADQDADPKKGTGAVMCCTFGDTADVQWWRTHHLNLIEAIDRQGQMTAATGHLQGMTTTEARESLVSILNEAGLILEQKPLDQSIRVHERCDTPVEYILTQQWFIRILDYKDAFLRAGNQVNWHPPHMKNRFIQWVQDLSWDWGISRQRYFGVPFPLWYCSDCGQIMTAEESELPLDPQTQKPKQRCTNCGGNSFSPDEDVMDTWATSSLSPQIVGGWQKDDQLYQRVQPFSCRPQAHEIIRTWAFYTIVKSHHHFGQVPWDNAMISGWGLAPASDEKLSKSRGGGAVSPLEIIQTTSADAVRYWAASTGLGKDAVIDEDRIRAGSKLVTKLWNVARFSERFLAGYDPAKFLQEHEAQFTPADRWILARSNELTERCTKLWQNYDYATAKSEVEIFFWRDLADNYLEMAKKRLYEDQNCQGTQLALYQALITTIKLLAPILPHVTERVYTEMFAQSDGSPSIHISAWPKVTPKWLDESALSMGNLLLNIATAVRRFKSENNLSLGAELAQLHLASNDEALLRNLAGAASDLSSITRAQSIIFAKRIKPGPELIQTNHEVNIGVVLEAENLV